MSILICCTLLIGIDGKRDKLRGKTRIDKVERCEGEREGSKKQERIKISSKDKTNKDSLKSSYLLSHVKRKDPPSFLVNQDGLIEN